MIKVAFVFIFLLACILGFIKESQQENTQTIETIATVDITQEPYKPKESEYFKGRLKGQEVLFNKLQIKYNVNKWLILAICLHESANGTSNLISSRNNPAGILNDSYTDFRKFSTLEEGIERTFYIIRNYYMDEGLTTIKQIGSKYCPAGDTSDKTNINKYWVPSVSKLYEEMKKNG